MDPQLKQLRISVNRADSHWAVVNHIRSNRRNRVDRFQCSLIVQMYLGALLGLLFVSLSSLFGLLQCHRLMMGKWLAAKLC